MRALAQLAVWLVAALVAGGMALGWSPAPEEVAAQSSRHEIRGTVSGPSGEPLEGIAVEAWGESGEDTFGPWSAVPTGTDGSFSLEVPEGRFRLRLSLEFEGSGACFLGYFGSDGRRATYGEVALVAVAGGDVEGLAIALSGLPSEVCQRVEGVVVDPRGQPVAGSLVTFGDRELRRQRTDPTGTFRLHLPEGRYLVQIQTDLGKECTVEGYKGAAPGRPARIDVDGGGVDGLRIALSGGSSASLTSIFCSFPPAMATTTLRPGWNLAGWTAGETDASALFEAIPALEAAYAWDAGTQAFKGAGRDDPAGTGDLTTIAPGMGLWLLLGGEEPVTWTQPATPAGGFVSLQARVESRGLGGSRRSGAGGRIRVPARGLAGGSGVGGGHGRFPSVLPRRAPRAQHASAPGTGGGGLAQRGRGEALAPARRDSRHGRVRRRGGARDAGQHRTEGRRRVGVLRRTNRHLRSRHHVLGG